jgi:hypothetical protein
MLVLVAIGASLAAPLETETFEPRPVAGWALLEVRGGLQAAEGATPMFCVEAAAPRWLTLEGCGSGAGFLYPAGGQWEMVHFRGEANVPLRSWGRTEAFLQPGAGVAEIEAGQDQAGFLFGEARSADQREGAGLEGSVSGKVRLWPTDRLHVDAELNVGGAWIPSAPVVLGTASGFVPFAIGSVGVGF